MCGEGAHIQNFCFFVYKGSALESTEFYSEEVIAKYLLTALHSENLLQASCNGVQVIYFELMNNAWTV